LAPKSRGAPFCQIYVWGDAVPSSPPPMARERRTMIIKIGGVVV